MSSDHAYTVNANCQPDLPADQRLSDQELLDIINTMLSAGYVGQEPLSTNRLILFSSDTTSLAISWTLHYLSVYPEIQARLKEELATVPVYAPSQVCSQDEFMAHFDAIDHLPYFDAVMKETIRLSPSVHSTVRVAMTDDEIPLSEEVIMRDGTVEKTFKVKKGQWIHVPLEATSVDKTVWGEDAWEFRRVLVLF
jgi:cytochrome P450